MVVNVATAIFCLQSNTFYGFVTSGSNGKVLEKQQEWLTRWFLTSNASVLTQNKEYLGAISLLQSNEFLC